MLFFDSVKDDIIAYYFDDIYFLILKMQLADLSSICTQSIISSSKD